MPSIGYGDMASTYLNIMQNARIKADLTRLGEELASGKTSDLAAATGGDLGGYAALEATIARLESYKIAGDEVALFAEAMQIGLGQIQDLTTDTGPALLSSGHSVYAVDVEATAGDVRSKFETVVSLLNTRVADRSVMAGTGTAGPALADFETIMASLNTAIAATTDATSIAGAVDTWFDTVGGDFETVGYLGTTDSLAPVRIGQSEQANITLRADDTEIRELLKGYAMAALVADGALSGDVEEQSELMRLAGEQMIAANDGLSNLRSRIGTLEAQIEQASVRNAAELSAMEIARSDIVSVDQYKVATELTATETQLETLYAITARMSRLSLANYLS